MILVYTIHGSVSGKPYRKVLNARKCRQLEHGSNCIDCDRKTEKDVLKWFRENTGMPRSEIKDRMTVAEEMRCYSQEKTWATVQNLGEWKKQSKTFPAHLRMKRLFSTINGGESSGGCYRRNPVEKYIALKNVRLKKENEQEIMQKAFASKLTLKYRYQSYKSATYARDFLDLLYSNLLALRKVNGWPHIKKPGSRILTHAELKLVIRHIVEEKLQSGGRLSISVSRTVCTNCRLLLFLIAIQGRYRFALLSSQRKAQEEKETGGGNQQQSLHLRQYIWIDGIKRKMISYTQKHVSGALVCETMYLKETSPEQVIDYISSEQIKKISP